MQRTNGEHMDENTFWAFFLKCAALVLCVLIVTIGGCSAYESRLISEALASGKDPIEVRCAFGYGKDVCLIRAVKK